MCARQFLDLNGSFLTRNHNSADSFINKLLFFNQNEYVFSKGQNLNRLGNTMSKYRAKTQKDALVV